MDEYLYKVFFYGNKKTPSSPDGETNYLSDYTEACGIKERMSHHCEAVDIITYTCDENGFITYDDSH